MSPEQMAAYEAIMTTTFTCVELNLYLDTHPWDEKALEHYNMHAGELMNQIADYEALYGPLLNFGHSTSGSPWQWTQSPWPWESGRGV